MLQKGLQIRDVVTRLSLGVSTEVSEKVPPANRFADRHREGQIHESPTLGPIGRCVCARGGTGLPRLLNHLSKPAVVASINSVEGGARTALDAITSLLPRYSCE